MKSLLEEVDELSEVSGSPKIKFRSYPAAHVVPSENTNEYETTTENVRIYAFTLRLFYETKSTDIDDAMSGLEEVVDAVLDLFDQEDLKDSDDRTIGVDLPSGYTFLNIFAIPGVWGSLDEDALLMAEINVRVRISRDIT